MRSAGHTCWLPLGLGLALASAAAAGEELAPPPEIHFTPESDEYAAAAAEYDRIWAADGARIVEALERATGLAVEAGPIRAIVLEAPSSSGYRDIPMRLRASYPEATKRGTLIHELGHRLLGDLVPKDFEDHPVLFLFLYDVWVELYGREFADDQVKVESRRKGIYDYETAWREALSLSREERSARLHEFLSRPSAERAPGQPSCP